MNGFLENQDVINSGSPWDETTLVFRNHIGENCSQPLGNNLVNNVAQSNGPELGNSSRVFTFGNETEKSLIHLQDLAWMVEAI